MQETQETRVQSLGLKWQTTPLFLLGKLYGQRSLAGYSPPLHYFCLENYMDKGVWQATVQGVAKSQTQLRIPGK